ncbi:DUF6089 family protein [Fulvivirga sediminis]|uniref:DUF6089 domain-containing protein n=1 Tax=Fulvivirga sediminis TaxID=2803949 RepID=A0A937F262_9BACT|nr:DUF6089 family protein [Fulvivirga sediminis]MBL3654902.1 hypothetical protein [Fulvivirga sediminis]
MKRFFTIAICLLFYLVSVQDGNAQIRSKKVKRNNKRMANYRGKKSTFGNKRYNYVGVSVSAFNYFGDLSPLSNRISTDISTTKPGIGIFFGRRFGPRYTLRASFNYGTVSGSDYKSADPNDEDAKFRYIRNLHFRNRIKELSVTAVIDLLSNESTYINRVQFTPYVYGGVTVFHHNPQAYVPEESGLPEAGEWVDLQPLGTEGQFANLQPGDQNEGIKPYSRIQVAIPMGVGFRYRLNQVIDLSIETGMRYLFTDYLDDVSRNYVNSDRFTGDNAALASYMSDLSRATTGGATNEPRDLSNPSIAEIYYNTIDVNGEQKIRGYGSESPTNIRGNSNDKDLYFVSSFKIAFIIGATYRRAKFR